MIVACSVGIPLNCELVDNLVRLSLQSLNYPQWEIKFTSAADMERIILNLTSQVMDSI